ncbi:MAG TPA: YdeI/OmpD-associated family protein [Galbitalea sp.]
MAGSFTSVIVQAEGMSATGIPVPDAVVAGLGAGKNPPVTVSLRPAGSDAEWYSYRISIATRDGQYIMSFSSAHRAASGLGAGDEIDVMLELDTTPRTMVIPEDLASALTAAGALDAFLTLSYSRQRAHIEPVEAAKAIDTRQRRIAKIVAEVAAASRG